MMLNKYVFENIIDDIDAGYWELNVQSNTSYWSTAFIKNLGYTFDDVTVKLDYFLDHIIHPDDRDSFKNNFYNLVGNNDHFKQNISILHKNGQYKEYVCKTNEELPVNIQIDSKVIFFFEIKFETHKKIDDEQFYFQETAAMTSTGSWYVDFNTKKSYWDLQTRRILEYPDDFVPSLKIASTLYAKEHQELAADAFFNCAMTGKPFEVEILMLTAKGRKFWAKAMGKAVYNDHKEIKGMRGVFQDIDAFKRKEFELQKTSDVVASQNSRLFNFAHIVSHNLRSHSSNLALITQMIEDIENPEEKLELLDNIKDISQSLNTTIEHLNEVVTIQTGVNQDTELVNFKDTLSQVMRSVGHIIKVNKAVIHSDFSEVDTIEYIPAYLESIMLNLITNAIKYKHKERDPVIQIKTYSDAKRNGRTVMEIADNGRGIDMEKFGDKLFGMYKTFHYNEDAVGIGLFITKNQIESLNGEIFVESDLHKGTTFIIKF